MGLTPFKKPRRPPNVFSQQADNAMAKDGKTPVAWDFVYIPSEEWKKNLKQALIAYAADNGEWNGVKNAFVDGWKTEKAALEYVGCCPSYLISDRGRADVGLPAPLFYVLRDPSMGKALKRWWPLFVLPTCLAFIIGFVIPFIQGFYLSFCQFITINNAHFVGIENYVRALSDPQFATSFFFTVAFAFLSTVLINVIALAIAQALTRKALKGTNIFRTIFFMPNLIGGIVLGYIWQILLNCLLSNVGARCLPLTLLLASGALSS